MKILHLASFNGNIGDVLSHAGLYKILKIDHGIQESQIFKLDIRKFYQRNRKNDRHFFDAKCAEQFNKFNLIIIGGGGFFKQDFPASQSGNTFDFSENFFQSIKTKVLFYSIGGLSPKKNSDKVAYEKTELFLEKLISDERFELIFRTDGSVENSQILSKMLTEKGTSNSFLIVLT